MQHGWPALLKSAQRSIRDACVYIVGGSVVGLIISVLVPNNAEFIERWIGSSVFFTSLFLGFVVGEYGITLQANRWRPAGYTMVYLGLIATLLGVLMLVGLRIRPFIEQSENQILFPLLFVVGLWGGSRRSGGRTKDGAGEKRGIQDKGPDH